MRSLSKLVYFVGSACGLSNFVIPGWDLQSTIKAGDDLAKLSSPSYDSSSWTRIGSRATVFGGLIDAGVYNTDQLFYSMNLQDTVNYLPYYSPWLYRSKFSLSPKQGNHFFLQTNGITSKADIYLNGKEVADKLTQAGAYGGHTYDITEFAQENNALVVKAYPTDYNKDFALGWVDWNPYPPDNGTGVWRNVSVKQTGPVLMGSIRITHDYVPGAASVQVVVWADMTNLEASSTSGVMEGTIRELDGDFEVHLGQSFKLRGHQTQTVAIFTTIENAKIWWPKQWGDQPLYTVQASVRAPAPHGTVSDTSGVTQFGIRNVTSRLNLHHDRIFEVNGYPFQVRGGGYAPDMFLRWDEKKFEAQAQYILDMGLNTIRLEGKMEQPEMYDVADRVGLMIMPGWECCDKWEAWSYNNEIPGKVLWDENDYHTANASMRHEASMLQTHPSILDFLVGSDYWPDNRAAAIYVEALDDFDWQNPIVCSAAKRGFPKILGKSGMKMLGPYDWVPPNYWYGHHLGAAFGFGSELGAGVGTPEIGSLKKFLSPSDLDDLWTKPHKGLYHMSTNVSSFFNRHIYDRAMFERYGEPSNLDEYLLKAQIMDYEATRAEFEGFSAYWNAERPATGAIYWMLNNAWPSLHWNLFDYYLHPAGAYFGTKVGSRMEHVAYNYDDGTVYLINHSTDRKGSRTVHLELIDSDGKVFATKTVTAETEPDVSKSIGSVPGLDKTKDVAFLKLILSDSGGTVLSRNVYWLATSVDRLDWAASTWFFTRVASFADYTALNNLKTASVFASASSTAANCLKVTLHNQANVPAFFIRLNLVDSSEEDVVPVHWSDNYVTLFPHEELVLEVTYPEDAGSVNIQMSGSNIGPERTIGK